MFKVTGYTKYTMCTFPSTRSCSGLTVISYSKDDRNIRKLDKRLEDLFEQYKIFKKNLDLNFELCERPELKG